MCRFLLVAMSLLATSCSRDSGTGMPNIGSSTTVDRQDVVTSGEPVTNQSTATLRSNTRPVAASAAVSKSTVVPGEETRLTISLDILPGWHIYGIGASGPNQPSRLALQLPKGIAAAEDWSAPVPESFPTTFGIAPIYQSAVTFSRPLKIDESASSGKSEIACELTYQACNHEQCLPPTTIFLSIPLEVKQK
jgi:DsbC/DsbD-like thiol-disulfide interchange protein